MVFFPTAAHLSEDGDHWIAGVHHRFDERLRLRLEAYVKNYDRLKPRFENLYDPLALIPEVAPDRIGLLPESARASGLETTLEFRGGEELDWWVTWSWARVADRIDGVSEPRSWDQRHALLAGLAWAETHSVSLQHSRPILNLAASFQSPEEGLEHQVEPLVNQAATAESEIAPSGRLEDGQTTAGADPSTHRACS